MSWNRIFIVVITLLSGCSKLADYKQDVASPAPVPSPSITVSVPDPIHAWTFENNGNDSGSTGGWTGTMTGTYSSTAGDFKVGSYAAKFSAGQSFSLGAQTFPSELTVACWVRWLSGSAPNAIIANSAQGLNVDGFRLYVQASGQVVLETGTGGAGVAVDSVSLLSSGVYTHVVAEFDNVLNQSAIYVNGVLDQSGTVQPGYNLTAAAFLGSMSGSTVSFNGELDDCRIYNVALSAQQVTLLYNSY
jgi:hypothetical protein